MIGPMKPYLPLILVIFAHSSILGAANMVTQEDKDLPGQAEKKADIFELPSFEMKANVRIINKGQPLDGSYVFLWNGPDQWREEINLPGYSEVHVGGKGVVFNKPSSDFMLFEIRYLRSALDYGRRIALGPKDTFKRVHDRNVNGVKVKCALIADQENHNRDVCVDALTGALVRQTPFLDRELTPVGAKLFPRFLSYVENGKSLAEVQVTELKTTEPSPPSAFEPPAGAVSNPGCWNPDGGRLVKRVNPIYPVSERVFHAQGTVALYAVIAADGILHNLRIISGVTPGLNKASLDGVEQWRYEPFTCKGKPVDVETVVFVNYALNF
jgi:hypothetical protein